MDVTQHFSGRAADYTAARPDYAAEAMAWLVQHVFHSAVCRVADIGSGTGKFTRQLLNMGHTVYAVEPNDDMRHTAIRELGEEPRFHAVRGTAENSTLPAACVDAVTTAQAFHWFDPVSFRAECQRILKPGGQAILLWNMRDMSDPVNAKSYEIYTRFCPRFRGFGGGIQKDDPRMITFFGGVYTRTEFSHPLFLNRETFIRRSLSSSYSLKAGDENYDAYMDALHTLFDRYATSSLLAMGNHTVLYTGTV